MACVRASFPAISRRLALRKSTTLRLSPRPSGIPCRRPRGLEFQALALHHEAKMDTPTETKSSSENWKIKMLYDGDCPLCMREVNMLRARNEKYRAIKFVNIGSEDYSPEDNQGLDYKTVMGRIHAILSDGTVVKDVEAFRKLYEEVGLGWVYAVTKYEPVATIASVVYGIWAKYRLQITGRSSLEEILDSRMRKLEKVCRDDDSCKM